MVPAHRVAVGASLPAGVLANREVAMSVPANETMLAVSLGKTYAQPVLATSP
jgi:hypothetical protein